MKLRLLTVLLLAGTSTAVAACVARPPSGPDCAWTAERGPADAPGRTIFVVDVSNSLRDAQGRAPDYARALADRIDAAVAAHHTVGVVAFDDQLIGGIQEFRTWRDRKDPGNQAADIRTATTCVTAAIAAAQASPAARSKSNTLAMMRAASDWLRASGGTKAAVLATDGLPTTGCANLTRAPMRDPAEIPVIVAACRGAQHRELNEAQLGGVDVTMIGVGHVASDLPSPSAAQVAWLTDFWEAVCAGGQAQSCTVSTTQVPWTANAPGSESATDPVVTFAAPWKISLPAAALFDTGRAELRKDVLGRLLRVAVDIRGGDFRQVVVAGYADRRGDENDNLDLSQRRADAVAAYLRGHGVSPTRAVGYGEGHPVCPGVDPQCLQQNRRVEIIAS